MTEEHRHQAFKNENAANFDKQREKLSPLKDALHLIMQAVFDQLPNDARILCVGAGTGAELLDLAAAFPQWQFSVIEPEADMMAICQQKAQQHQILSRCEFHQGYLDSYQGNIDFDAATAILVSHFIAGKQQRIAFFSEISRRLRQGGLFVNADLSAGYESTTTQDLMPVWQAMHQRAGIHFNPDAFAGRVAMLSLAEMEDILTTSGFSHPVLFYQALYIRAWYSKIA